MLKPTPLLKECLAHAAKVLYSSSRPNLENDEVIGLGLQFELYDRRQGIYRGFRRSQYKEAVQQHAYLNGRRWAVAFWVSLM